MFAPFLRCCLWFAVFVHFALNCSCLPLYQLLQRASEIASKFQVFFSWQWCFFNFSRQLERFYLTHWPCDFMHLHISFTDIVILSRTVTFSLSLPRLYFVRYLPASPSQPLSNILFFHYLSFFSHPCSHCVTFPGCVASSQPLPNAFVPFALTLYFSAFTPPAVSFESFCHLLSLLCPWFLSMFLIFFRTF